MPNIKTVSKPFLNWLGGKRKIADKLNSYIPSELNNYYERQFRIRENKNLILIGYTSH